MFEKTGIKDNVTDEICSLARKHGLNKVEEDVNTLLFFDIVNLDGPADQELLKSIHREGVLIYEKV